MKKIIETERLVLRHWEASDIAPFAEMSADPRVMEFFPETLSRAEAEASIQIFEDKMEANGIGYWPAEIKETREFIGFIGLSIPSYPLHFSPCVEIGWRLAFEFWGKGYAQEGASACLKFGFQSFGLDEIVSFAPTGNLRSRNVMEKIGMTHDLSGDFDHPKLPAGHHLRKHVLYRKLKAMTQKI